MLAEGAMSRSLREIWAFRNLIKALVLRHLATRYRGSVLGFLWSFLNPLCLIAVYALVFKYYIRFEQVENYTLFMFVGLLPWIWFSSSLIEAASSISSGGSLITKAMFPPQVLPLVVVLTNLINYLLSLPLLFGFMLFSGIYISPSAILFIPVVFIELVFLVGLSFAISAINVRYRDVQHIIGNLLTLWFFLCPILYPINSVPEAFRFTLVLNPIAIFTQMYHQILFDGVFPSYKHLAYVFVVSFVVLYLGIKIFDHFREEFAELV